MTNIQKTMERFLLEEPEYRYYAAYDPCETGIRALTLEGAQYKGARTKIFAYYGLPGNREGPVPAIVLIHGGGGHAFHEWVYWWMTHGYAAIAMETTGFMPGKKNAGFFDHSWTREWNGDFSEKNYTPGPDNDGLTTADDEPENQWMYHAVSCGLLAHAFLRHQPEVDVRRIGVMGISWGGIITSLLIGYDPLLAFAIPVYGSGYLGEGLGWIHETFQNEAVRRLWLAEDRFDRVTCPVLWTAWNDDLFFSVQSNSLSYEHTRSGQPGTRLSLIDGMGHGDVETWVRKEPYFFADAIVGKGPAVPEITEHSDGRTIRLVVNSEAGVPILRATAFYITEPMTYRMYDKYGFGACPFMTQTWKLLPLEASDGTFTGTLPPDAAGYYAEVLFAGFGKVLTVTTGYHTL